eukprot:7391659-Prymnesium_polylepis.3
MHRRAMHRQAMRTDGRLLDVARATHLRQHSHRHEAEASVRGGARSNDLGTPVVSAQRGHAEDSARWLVLGVSARRECEQQHRRARLRAPTRARCRNSTSRRDI